MFKLLPSARVRWRDVWGGAFVTALLFSLGNLALGLYLGKAGASSAYGAAGSLMTVLLWTYYCAQIFYFGAEITRARGSPRRPAVRRPP
jgi:membrane protein